MARIRFTVGVRYLLHGQVYRITQILLEDRVRVAHQRFGGHATVPVAELRAAWAQGELRFEVVGKQARMDLDHPIATEYTIADFQHLPERYRTAAWRRYAVLKPLLAWPSDPCPWVYLEQYAQTLTARNPDSSSEEPSEPRRGKPMGHRMGMAHSASSIYRWLCDFRDSGYDVRSLVPAYAQSGANGPSRIHQDNEDIIQQVLAECQATPRQRTMKDIHLQVIHRIAEENRTRPDADQLPLPGQTTMYRRIQRAGTQALLRRRQRRLEQQADHAVDAGPESTRILERVEIDHTLLDLFLVDEEDRLPIGRPTLTYTLDVCSGFPLGMFVSFEPPSYRAVMSCLLHAILPKPDPVELYETTHPWEAYGLPEKLVVDNGPEFIGYDLENACAHLGIILEQVPVKTPWFKGSVERFFRTNNTGTYSYVAGHNVFQPAGTR
jgi:putative transposase